MGAFRVTVAALALCAVGAIGNSLMGIDLGHDYMKVRTRPSLPWQLAFWPARCWMRGWRNFERGRDHSLLHSFERTLLCVSVMTACSGSALPLQTC